MERQIGDYRHIFGKYKNSADMQKINDEIECTYIADKDEVMMCTNAAHLYIQAYGIQRTRRGLRCDVGTSRCWTSVHTLLATVAPQSMALKVRNTTAAEVYKTRSMSVRRMVQAEKKHWLMLSPAGLCKAAALSKQQ